MSERDAKWWENQATQYKAELDQLNPQLNVANARISELAAKVALNDIEKAAALESAATAKADLETKAAALNAALSAVDDQAAALQTAHAELTRLRDALAKKNAALAPCLAGVANQLALIKTAIEAE